eukprot:m.42043 g.42043  ORF g.42043 m.42043 type:complete len:496 (-) comp11509_c1_seq1:163-1650(-)
MALAKLRSKLGGEDTDPFANYCAGAVDAKTPARVTKFAQKLTLLTQNKRLNLKNSPPFLQGILIDTQELVNTFFQKSPLEELKTNDYLCVFVTKFCAQCKKALKLFKDAKERMEDEKGVYRRELNKITLVFSHMLAELRAMFKKEGTYNPNFKIVKSEAREFWTREFSTRVIVPWNEFMHKFTLVHQVFSKEERDALKSTMDMTENNHITWFEFDIFTRLFQPWEQLLNNWNVIAITHPGYQAFMTYDEVEACLKQWIHKPGSYVFRLSCTRLGQWAIGFVTPQHKIVQTIPQSKSLYQALVDGAADGSYIYPNGSDHNPDITQQIRASPEQHISVTKEQYDMYCDIDTTFELCKICNSNMKNVRIEPCGHLLCSACLRHWIETGAAQKREADCPFCRDKILSTEGIVIDPFDPFADDDDEDGGMPVPSEDVAPLARREPPAIPAAQAAGGAEPINETLAKQLMEMGFERRNVEKALRVARNELQVATDILLQFS